jgi:hypothetical protein
MKLRLEGMPAECEQAAEILAQTFEVVSVSDPYPNRGWSLLVRVYVEVRLDTERHHLLPAEPAEPRRWRVMLYRLDQELPSR